MRSVLYQTVENSNIDPVLKQEALEEITKLEELEDFDMDSSNIEQAFVWDDSDLDLEFWTEVADQLSYADLEYRNDESIDFTESDI